MWRVCATESRSLMHKEEAPKKAPLRPALSAIFVIGTVCAFAAASLFCSEENPVWNPLLAMHDRTFAALGSDTVGDVYVTKERLLRRRVSYSGEQLEEAAGIISGFAQNSKAPVWFLGVPTSAGIYADTLSESAPYINERTLLRTFSEELDSKVNWLEAASWLYGMKDQYVYYRTDSRWTSYGAFYIYQSVIRKLGFHAVGYDHYTITHFTDEYYGDLAQEIRYYDVQPDLVDLYTAENESKPISINAFRADLTSVPLQSYYRTEEAAAAENAYAVFGLEQFAVLQMELSSKSAKSLLLLCDSFGSTMLPFLWQHYRNVTAVNLSLARETDWQALTEEREYSHVIILCSTETLLDEHGLDALHNRS